MFMVVRTTTLEVPQSCLCESQVNSFIFIAFTVVRGKEPFDILHNSIAYDLARTITSKYLMTNPVDIQHGSVTGECNKNRHVSCKCPCYTKSDRVVMCDDKSVFNYARYDIANNQFIKFRH